MQPRNGQLAPARQGPRRNTLLAGNAAPPEGPRTSESKAAQPPGHITQAAPMQPSFTSMPCGENKGEIAPGAGQPAHSNADLTGNATQSQTGTRRPSAPARPGPRRETLPAGSAVQPEAPTVSESKPAESSARIPPADVKQPPPPSLASMPWDVKKHSEIAQAAGRLRANAALTGNALPSSTTTLVTNAVTAVGQLANAMARYDDKIAEAAAAVAGKQRTPENLEQFVEALSAKRDALAGFEKTLGDAIGVLPTLERSASIIADGDAAVATPRSPLTRKASFSQLYTRVTQRRNTQTQEPAPDMRQQIETLTTELRELSIALKAANAEPMGLLFQAIEHPRNYLRPFLEWYAGKFPQGGTPDDRQKVANDALKRLNRRSRPA